jgi:hypothetical protein
MSHRGSLLYTMRNGFASNRMCLAPLMVLVVSPQGGVMARDLVLGLLAVVGLLVLVGQDP